MRQVKLLRLLQRKPLYFGMFTRKPIAWIPTPGCDKVEVILVCAVLLRGGDLNYFQRDSMQL